MNDKHTWWAWAIKNSVCVICWTGLAIWFNHWWIALFAKRAIHQWLNQIASPVQQITQTEFLIAQAHQVCLSFIGYLLKYKRESPRFRRPSLNRKIC